MPPSGIPSFFWQPSVFYLELYFLFIIYYEFCLEHLVWYESLLVLLCVLSLESLLDTPFWEIQNLCYACFYASLKLLEPWNCSSASLIYFWARCALLFLKKFSLASLKLFWEKENCYAHDLHLYLFELIKSNTRKLVPIW